MSKVKRNWTWNYPKKSKDKKQDKQIKLIKNYLTPEIKFRFLSNAGVNMSQAPAWTGDQIGSTIVRGVLPTERVGDKIRIIGLELNWTVLNQSAGSMSTHRFLLVKARGPVPGAFNLAALLADPNVPQSVPAYQSIVRPSKKMAKFGAKSGQFSIIKDFGHRTLAFTNNVNGAVADISKTDYRKRFKMNHTVSYIASTPAVTDVDDGSIFLLGSASTSAAANFQVYTLRVGVFYTDS